MVSMFQTWYCAFDLRHGRQMLIGQPGGLVAPCTARTQDEHPSAERVLCRAAN